MLFACRLLVLICIALAGPTRAARAGGGPENVLLVVNQNSDASMTIANHYIRLRDIPPTNVLYLDWKHGTAPTGGTLFRDEILTPVLKAIDERKLSAQITYIVYSSDFPTRVDFRKQFADEKLPKQFTPVASLTGVTYLWPYVAKGQAAFTMPTVNWYVPPAARNNQASCIDCANVETRGFGMRQFWGKDGQVTSDSKTGQTYMLSTMLGVTATGGNTVDEVVHYLNRSAAIDGGHPVGTFYFMKNNDVRSKTRHDCYAAVAAKLRSEGAEAEVQEGTVPASAPAAMGIMAGAASLEVDPGKVTLVPGAICDHFTSYGGIFDQKWQTTLAVWLRAGAAGSSGTVEEPYAIQAKFPLPSMHLHYWRGTSLAEAFYQSVSGPYQLLIVGDPLCQPFAKPPKVEVEGMKPNQVLGDKVELKAKVVPQAGTKAGMMELYLDGRLMAAGLPAELTLPLNTAGLAPGMHEFRLVAATDDPIGFRGRAILPVRVGGEADADNQVQMEVTPQPMVSAGTKIRVTVRGPADAAGIEILQNQRRVGFVDSASGSVEIDSSALGRGPVGLVAQVVASDPPATSPAAGARSATCWILIR
ncbi:TIGR03790 family protein [Aeoliella sp. SH292]|uniref:TIGR03790 family protein n=1 Tax=Aeoliella sp. SH292 TaxID=3454464 RepID=UPI003F96FC6B